VARGGSGAASMPSTLTIRCTLPGATFPSHVTGPPHVHSGAHPGAPRAALRASAPMSSLQKTCARGCMCGGR
jgi:hypothetical protein